MQQRIKYFSFWDVPRTFAFEQAGKVYVLTSEFDDDLDEYPDDYEVFIVSGIANLSVASEWKFIEPMPKIRVGKVPVAAVHFVESRRKFVDSSFWTASSRWSNAGWRSIPITHLKTPQLEYQAHSLWIGPVRLGEMVAEAAGSNSTQCPFLTRS